MAYDLRVSESKPGRTLVTPMNVVDVSAMTCANALCKCPHCYKVGQMRRDDTQKVRRADYHTPHRHSKVRRLFEVPFPNPALFEEGLNSQI